MRPARIGRDGLEKVLRDTIRDRVDVETAPRGFSDGFVTEAGRMNVATLARVLPVLASRDLSQALAAMRCPMLAAVPGADPLHTVDECRALQRLVPGCESVALDGMPNDIADTAPYRCARELFRSLHARVGREVAGRCRRPVADGWPMCRNRLHQADAVAVRSRKLS